MSNLGSSAQSTVGLANGTQWETNSTLSGITALCCAGSDFVLGKKDGNLYRTPITQTKNGFPSIGPLNVLAHSAGGRCAGSYSAVDVLLANEHTTLLASLSGGTILSVYGLSGASPDLREDIDLASFVECTVMPAPFDFLKASAYVPLSTAHCWLSPTEFVLSCVDGTLLHVAVDASRLGQGREGLTVRILHQEISPVVQLATSNKHQLGVSTVQRTGFLLLTPREDTLTQGTLPAAHTPSPSPYTTEYYRVGQRDRPPGAWGVSFAQQSKVVFCARPARRIFQADANPQSNVDYLRVVRTIRLPDQPSEIGLLWNVSDMGWGAASSGENDSGGTPNVSTESGGIRSPRTSLAMSGGEAAGETDELLLTIFDRKDVLLANLNTLQWTRVVPLPQGLLTRSVVIHKNFLIVLTDDGNHILTLRIGEHEPRPRAPVLEDKKSTLEDVAKVRDENAPASEEQQTVALKQETPRETEKAEGERDEVAEKLEVPQTVPPSETVQSVGLRTSDPTLRLEHFAEVAPLEERESGSSASKKEPAESEALFSKSRASAQLPSSDASSSSGRRRRHHRGDKDSRRSKRQTVTEDTAPVPEGFYRASAFRPPDGWSAEAESQGTSDQQEDSSAARAVSEALQRIRSTLVEEASRSQIVAEGSDVEGEKKTPNRNAEATEEAFFTSPICIPPKEERGTADDNGSKVLSEEASAPPPEDTTSAEVVEENDSSGVQLASPKASQPPEPPHVPCALPPAMSETLTSFGERTAKLYNTYRVCSFERREHSRIFREILRWLDELSRALDEEEDRIQKEDKGLLSTVAPRFFGTDPATTNRVLTLLKCCSEWTLTMDLPPHHTVQQVGKKVLSLVERLNLVEVDLYDTYCSIVDHLCPSSEFLELLHRPIEYCTRYTAAADVKARLEDVCREGYCFPSAGATPEVIAAWKPHKSKWLGSIETKIIESNSSVFDQLLFGPEHLPVLLHYFPYVFASMPYGVSRIVLEAFPSLSTFHMEWALSEPVHKNATNILKKCGTTHVECFNVDDLENFLCDFVGQLIQTPEARDKILRLGDACSTERFTHCVDILLRRRLAYTRQVRGKNGIIERKISRLEMNVLEVLRWSVRAVSVDTVFPNLRDLFDKYEFPRGIVELNQTDDYIRHHLRKKQIHSLFPLFQLGDSAVSESHWVILLQGAHREEKLNDAVVMQFAILGDPVEIYRLIVTSFSNIFRNIGDSTARGSSLGSSVPSPTKELVLGQAAEIRDSQLKNVLNKIAVLL